MKIDFNARFLDVIRRVDRPIAPDSKEARGPEFHTLLSSISPHRSQVVETPKLSPLAVAPPTQPIPTQVAPMARYNLPRPEPVLPRVENIISEPVGESIANETPVSVKTPTLVQAKRIPAEDPFKGLSRDERVSEVKRLAVEFGQKHGIDPLLSLAVASRESGFNPTAVSSDGHESKGLFQLLDSTAKDIMGRLKLNGEYKPFSPDMNAEMGISHLRYLHDIFSSGSDLQNGMKTFAAANTSSLENLALASFNAGEGRVASAQERAREQGRDPGEYGSVESYLPESTRKYVGDVQRIKSLFSDPEDDQEEAEI